MVMPPKMSYSKLNPIPNLYATKSLLLELARALKAMIPSVEKMRVKMLLQSEILNSTPIKSFTTSYVTKASAIEGTTFANICSAQMSLYPT